MSPICDFLGNGIPRMSIGVVHVSCFINLRRVSIGYLLTTEPQRPTKALLEIILIDPAWILASFLMDFGVGFGYKFTDR